MDLLLHEFVKVVKCISSRSKCRDLDHSEMEVLVVVVEPKEVWGTGPAAVAVEETGACAGGHPSKQHQGGGSTCSHSSSSTRAEP